jgi:hypothetical protein
MMQNSQCMAEAANIPHLRPRVAHRHSALLAVIRLLLPHEPLARTLLLHHAPASTTF